MPTTRHTDDTACPPPLALDGRLEVTHEDMARTTLFRDADVGLVLDRLQNCERRHYAAGEVVITQGAPNKALFIVLQGRLHIRLESAESLDVSVAVIGDCVGEMSVIDGRPATATVIAQLDSTLLVLPADFIWTLIDHTTLVSRNLLYILSGRMRMSDRLMAAGQRERARYRRLATQDLVTGARNRRWFEEEIAHRVERYQNDDEPLALMMFDVDNFKRFNDDYGHQVGDQVLQRVAHAAITAVGDRGTVARYGGEEFAVIMKPEFVAHAAAVAEAIRSGIQALDALTHDGERLPRLTVSAGVALLEDGMSASALVRRADEAQLAAKRAGRNRVVVAPRGR